MPDPQGSPSSPLIKLASGAFRLCLAPAIGGAVSSFQYQMANGHHIDLLRPMTDDAIASGDVLAASCFPLTPFSNRLRDGKCRFGDIDIQLPMNSDGPHAEHGHGWKRPWQIATYTQSSAVLLYQHQPDDWPFSYEMEQHFHLTTDGLAITLETRNIGNRTMPYGFGLHPYFARTALCRLTAGVEGFWAVDNEVMPTELQAIPHHADLTRGVDLRNVTLDNAFTGWSGRAVIALPEYKLELTMSASKPLGFLVVYVPAERDYVCVEPVSNCTDAFNLAQIRNDTGMIPLAAGEIVRAEIKFELRSLS